MSGFVDEAQIHVKAGDGGAGAVSFRREAHVDKGGPDGGDGGRGGDVWLVATTNQSSLLAFRDHPHRRAGDGGHGGGKKKHGARGADLEVPVPVGTRALRRATATLLADLARPGRPVAGRRGRAGRPGQRRLPRATGAGPRPSPSRARRATSSGTTSSWPWWPTWHWSGSPTWARAPSSRALSAAKPKIADYPFTTLEPHLGVVRAGDGVDFTVADIPGLVEGAADGKGLGHRFLRHITRARVLVVLVELEPVTGGLPLGAAPGAARRARPLPARPARPAPAGGRLQGRRGLARTCRSGRGTGPAAASQPDLVISAVTGQGIPAAASGRLARWWTEARSRRARSRTGASSSTGRSPRASPSNGSSEGDFAVIGRVAERAVALNDVTTDEAAAYVQDRLRRLGVDRALARAGARDGDLVHIGGLSFTWYRDQPEFTGRAGRPPVAGAMTGTDGAGDAHRGGQGRLLLGDHATAVRSTPRPSPSWPPRWPRPAPTGHRVVVVTSGAIAAGWPSLRPNRPRPSDLATLQAVAAVGQHRLMRVWSDALGRHGLSRRPGAARPARLRPPQPVPPRPPDPGPAARARAWSRWSTRTTRWPTRRSGSATTTDWPPWWPTWSAPTCWSC